MISESDHVLISTFDPDVATVEQPVATADGRLGFFSDLPDGPTRFAGGPIVMVRACKRGGQPDLESPPVEGRAELVMDGPLFDEVRTAVAERHGKSAVGEGMMDSVKGLFGSGTGAAYAVLVSVLA